MLRKSAKKPEKENKKLLKPNSKEQGVAFPPAPVIVPPLLEVVPPAPVIVPPTEVVAPLKEVDPVEECQNAAKNGQLEILKKYSYTFNNEHYVGLLLQHACVSGHKEIVRYLLGIKVSPNYRITYYETLLHIAKNNCIESLIEYGALIDARNSEGRPPLYEAIIRNDLAAVKLLLDAGANVNIRDKKGWTAIHHATTVPDDGSQIEIARLLMAKGADLNVELKYYSGCKPVNVYRWMIYKDHYQIAELIDAKNRERQASENALLKRVTELEEKVADLTQQLQHQNKTPAVNTNQPRGNSGIRFNFVSGKDVPA